MLFTIHTTSTTKMQETLGRETSMLEEEISTLLLNHDFIRDLKYFTKLLFHLELLSHR